MKKIVKIVFLLLITLTLYITVYSFQENNIILLNGEMIKLKKIINIDDSLYIPLREFCENTNISIYWNSKDDVAEVNAIKKEYTKFKNYPKHKIPQEGYIKEKKVAIMVGKSILESYYNEPMEYEDTNLKKSIQAIYDEESDVWVVSQLIEVKSNNIISEMAPKFVILSRSTGEILHISDPIDIFESVKSKNQ